MILGPIILIFGRRDFGILKGSVASAMTDESVVRYGKWSELRRIAKLVYGGAEDLDCDIFDHFAHIWQFYRNFILSPIFRGFREVWPHRGHG